MSGILGFLAADSFGLCLRLFHLFEGLIYALLASVRVPHDHIQGLVAGEQLNGPRVGAGVGQVEDPTALAVLEAVNGEDHLRHLERLPLGTPYPAVGKRMERMAAALPGAALVVDATGVGRVVVDHLRDRGLEPVAVSITAGRKTTFEDGTWHVPKRELLRPLITTVEMGRLKVAKGIPDAAAFLRELKGFTVTAGERGHVRLEGRGEHDDLVIAVALAVWWGLAATSGQA